MRRKGEEIHTYVDPEEARKRVKIVSKLKESRSDGVDGCSRWVWWGTGGGISWGGYSVGHEEDKGREKELVSEGVKRDGLLGIFQQPVHAMRQLKRPSRTREQQLSQRTPRPRVVLHCLPTYRYQNIYELPAADFQDCVTCASRGNSFHLHSIEGFYLRTRISLIFHYLLPYHPLFHSPNITKFHI